MLNSWGSFWVLLLNQCNFLLIYIAPDLTKFQWEKNRKLVNELKHRKANGENNLVISNGTIVSRKPRTVVIPRGPVLDNPASTSHSNSPPASPMNS